MVKYKAGKPAVAKHPDARERETRKTAQNQMHQQAAKRCCNNARTHFWALLQGLLAGARGGSIALAFAAAAVDAAQLVQLLLQDIDVLLRDLLLVQEPNKQ